MPYREPEQAYSKSWARNLEAPQTAGDGLGGLLPFAELAPVATRPQSGRMSTHLDLTERIELQAGLRAGDTQAALAVRLNRSAGTISMELKRNGGRAVYCAAEAHAGALARRGASQRGRCDIDSHPPYVVFVSVVHLVVFLGPTRIGVFLAKFSRLFCPVVRHIAVLNHFVLFLCVTLPWNFYETCIYN